MSLDPDRIPVVALAAMNQVHHEEARLLNALSATLRRCSEAGGPWDEVDAALDRLLAHMESHFAAEEARMRGTAFPPYPVHKAAHDQMLSLAREAARHWREGRDPAPLGTFLERTLPDWLLQHIATMDTVTAQFLHARGTAVGA